MNNIKDVKGNFSPQTGKEEEYTVVFDGELDQSYQLHVAISYSGAVSDPGLFWDAPYGASAVNDFTCPKGAKEFKFKVLSYNGHCVKFR